MKKLFIPILSSLIVFVHADEPPAPAESKNSGTAFFITDSGTAVASYHPIADATDISATVGGAPVSFEISSRDTVNDIAILTPKSKIQSRPVPLLMGDVALASSITNISFDNQDPFKPASLQGIVKSKTGVAGDIRHIELEFSAPIAPREGPLFNDKGLCIGWISNHATDIFSLLYEPKNNVAVSIATKVDYLYPLVKSLPGVLWAKDDSEANAKDWAALEKESVIRLEITKPGATPSVSGDALAEARKQIPEGALFISVSVASGVSNIDFANKLLDQLTKHKIGKTVSPAAKQKYYQALHERFGSSMTADQLVKMASDLSNGYYLEVECNVVTEEVEDSVSLTLYQPRSMDVLAQVRSAKVIKSNPEEAVLQLTEMAVKELAKQIKAKKLPLLAD